MQQDVLTALFNNVAILLVLSVIFEVTYLLPVQYARIKPVLSGMMIAAVCIVVMNMPYRLQPGIIYDTRSILISVTAYIFGLVPTLITVIAAILFRLILGGAGALPGIMVIITSALIGFSWRRWVDPRLKVWNWLKVYLMSILVHLTMLLCMFLLPYPSNLTVIRVIALPVMILYPITSVLLSLLLMRQKRYQDVQEQLRQSEERFRTLFDNAPLGYQSLDASGRFIEVNQQWLSTLGYTRDEVIGKWFGDFLAPEYVEAFRQRFPRFKAQGYIHTEFQMLHKQGHPLYISFEGKIGYGSEGQFQQTHCILQDI